MFIVLKLSNKAGFPHSIMSSAEKLFFIICLKNNCSFWYVLYRIKHLSRLIIPFPWASLFGINY